MTGLALFPLLALLPVVYSVPSVPSCPPMLRAGFMNPMAGEICPGRSFFHYYACCEADMFQCCFYFETWALVFFAIIGSILLIGAILAVVRFAMMQK